MVPPRATSARCRVPHWNGSGSRSSTSPSDDGTARAEAALGVTEVEVQRELAQGLREPTHHRGTDAGDPVEAALAAVVPRQAQLVAELRREEPTGDELANRPEEPPQRPAERTQRCHDEAEV